MTNAERLAQENAKHLAAAAPIIRKPAPPVPSRATAAESDDIRQRLAEEIGGLRVNLGKLLELVEAIHAVVVVPPAPATTEDPDEDVSNPRRRHR